MTARLELARVDDVAPDSSVRIDVDGHRIALIRIGDDFYAIGDECSHADVSLSEGEIDADDLSIECWKHGSLFCLATGAALTLPATRPVPSYTVEVVDGWVVALLDEGDE
ncbi:MAG: non-heme iron oxygenase ferredoxin subunit [Acidimicrobiia bacterium]|nr:non-heme iron oxygenase ferredoxin subunit [Acidimicrobiia bacterium]